MATGVAHPAAAIAASGFTVVAALQVSGALGGSWGLSAAWGGVDAGLSTGLRVASALAAVLLVVGATLVLGRAGYRAFPIPSGVLRWGTWAVVAVLSLSALANFASSSNWERFLNGPMAFLMALLCFTVARSAGPKR